MTKTELTRIIKQYVPYRSRNLGSQSLSCKNCFYADTLKDYYPCSSCHDKMSYMICEDAVEQLAEELSVKLGLEDK